jgi:hypothetical protein
MAIAFATAEYMPRPQPRSAIQHPFTYAATFHPVEHPLLGIDDSLAFNGRVCYYVSAVAGEST